MSADELSAVMEEAARYREFDRLMKFSVSRDGIPLAWRQALRLMLLISLVEGCQRGEVGALPLLMARLRSRRSTAPTDSLAWSTGRVGSDSIPRLCGLCGRSGIRAVCRELDVFR